MRRLSTTLLVPCLLACTLLASGQAAKSPDKVVERQRHRWLQAQFSTVAPAEAALSAWVALRRVPYWRGPNDALASWEDMGPSVLLRGWGGMENAGRTSAILIDPTNPRVVYAAAASGGLWKSTDGCATWTPIADYQASLSYGALAMDPFDHRTIYAGTGEAHYSFDSFEGVGLLRSRDAGATWELLGSDVFIRQKFARLVPHPNRTGFLYAATTGGIYRSTDAGGTWVKILAGTATDLLIRRDDPKSLIAAMGLPSGSPRNGLYRSRDGGESWTKLESDLPRDGTTIGRIQMDLCLAYPNVVYASLYGSRGSLLGIYRSSDFGTSWVRLPNAPQYAGGQSWYDNCLAVSPTNPNIVFVGGVSTFCTFDGGETWTDNTRSYAGGPIHPDHHFLAFDPTDPQRIYLCTDGGVFRTNNLGGSWESVSRGMGTIQFQSVDVHPSDKSVAYGGTQDNGTNKYTGSLEWLHTFTGDGGTTRVNWLNPNIVYTEYVNLVICKSKDAGMTWDWNTTQGIDRSEGALFYAPFNLDPSNPDVLVAGTRRVYRSTNGAESWQPISPLLGNPISAVTIAPNNPAVIYAGTSDGRAWVTPNTGKDWYEVTKGLPRAYIGDIAIDPRNARHAYLCQTGWGGNKVWKTTDAGGSWTPIGQGIPEAPARCMTLDPRNPDRLFVGTEVGVFVTEDSGAHWARYGRGLPISPVFSVVANRRTGYLTVGTHGRGAWRIPLP